MFRKLLTAVTSCVMCAAVLSGCGSADTKKNDGKLDIVCTVFAAYDWTREIVGDCDNVNITYLLSNGADLHSFQPSAEDIIGISDCDVFVYVGGGSDKWVGDALANARNKDMKIVDLMDALSDNMLEEELKEGMEPEDDDDGGYDEHIWLSINNAERSVSAIADALCAADPDNSETYTDNSERYKTELQMLDRSCHMLFDDKQATLIFGDRFPFRYFCADYGLDYYAAFPGCSADTEASFKTITFLAEKADEVGASTIFAIENSDCTIADAVIANTAEKSQKTAVLDSAQSVTAKQIADGTTYLSIMNDNYSVLKEAFNE